MNTRTSKGEDNEDFTPTGNTFYVKFFENKLKRAELGYSDMDATIVDRSYCTLRLSDRCLNGMTRPWMVPIEPLSLVSPRICISIQFLSHR